MLLINYFICQGEVDSVTHSTQFNQEGICCRVISNRIRERAGRTDSNWLSKNASAKPQCRAAKEAAALPAIQNHAAFSGVHSSQKWMPCTRLSPLNSFLSRRLVPVILGPVSTSGTTTAGRSVLRSIAQKEEFGEEVA